MKTEIKEIYKCDHCNKLYQRKGAAEAHEKACFHNPENKRKCLDCDHLKKKSTTYYEEYYGMENYRSVELFHCSKIDSFLYPPQVELKRNAFDLSDDDNQPMKKECDQYENETERLIAKLL